MKRLRKLLSDWPIFKSAPRRATRSPLDGVRVLDLSRMFAAPWCTQTLGDLGADVIKVERPVIGDDMRAYGPPFLQTLNGEDGDSPYYIAANRNKKSITVDISTAKGAKLIRDLAATCDVMVENYKVGDLARFGLDYPSIKAINPRIIYCSVTGFGQTGPYAHRPGLDSVFQATSGLMSITGTPDGPPQKVGMLVSDFTAGMYAAIGVLAALRHREVNGGEGQQIDIALMDCQMAALSNRAQHYLVSGETPQRQGSESPGNQPTGLFPCADGELMISAGSDSRFRALMQVIGRTDLCQDPRFATRRARIANKGLLGEMMAGILTGHPRAYWLALFDDAGVMAAPINTIAEAFEDPQVKYRQTVLETPHPTAGSVSLIASPLKFSKTPVPAFRAPPSLGHDTDEVLSDVLGMSAAQVGALRNEGIV